MKKNLIIEKGIKELDYHHFATPNEIMNLGKAQS